MRTTESGTITASRLFAACIWANSPGPLDAITRRELRPGLGVLDLRRASAMAEARSRPLTLNLIGMKRRLFSR